MLSQIKNIIIFSIIALALILSYVFFIKKNPEEINLISSSSSQTNNTSAKSTHNLDEDFLPFLLNVKNIKLNDSIFTDPAFLILVDSSIILVPEGNEGRPNPFAPFSVTNKVDTD